MDDLEVRRAEECVHGMPGQLRDGIVAFPDESLFIDPYVWDWNHGHGTSCDEEADAGPSCRFLRVSFSEKTYSALMGIFLVSLIASGVFGRITVSRPFRNSARILSTSTSDGRGMDLLNDPYERSIR